MGANGAVNKTLEYGGSAVADISVESRLSMCNMAVESLALNAVFPPDATGDRVCQASQQFTICSGGE